MDLSSLPITHRAVISPDYLDEMGHMNVMWYTFLFGRGIGKLFQMIGLDRTYFAANHAGSFALKQFTSYLAEVRVDEAVTIRSRLLGRSAKRLHLMQFMIKDVGEILAATSEILSSHMDMTTRRTSPFPEHIARSIDELLAQHTALGWEAPVCGVIKV